jgi:heme/copper-type cytochrome/quinol oxidase subunit 1
MGVPRRTDLGLSTYHFPPIVDHLEKMSAVGGIILYISSLIFFIVFLGTIFFGKRRKEESINLPVTEAYQTEADAPKVFDNWKIWIGTAVVLIIITYTPVLKQVLGVSPSVLLGITLVYQYLYPGRRRDEKIYIPHTDILLVSL